MKAIVLGNSFSLEHFPPPTEVVPVIFGVNRIYHSKIWRDKVTHYVALDPPIWNREFDDLKKLKNCQRFYTQDYVIERMNRKPKEYFGDKLIPLKDMKSTCVYNNGNISGYGHGWTSIYPCLLILYYEYRDLEEIELRGVDFGYREVKKKVESFTDDPGKMQTRVKQINQQVADESTLEFVNSLEAKSLLECPKELLEKGKEKEATTHFFGNRRKRQRSLECAKRATLRLLKFLDSRGIKITVLSELRWWK